MPRQTNRTRAARVQLIARAYIPVSGDDPEGFLSDLLTDIQHWAAAKRMPFAACLMRANGNFAAEKLEEGRRH